MRRKLGWRPSGVLMVGVVVVGVVLATTLGRTHRAVPVAQTAGGASRSAAARTAERGPGVARLNAPTSAFSAKPGLLTLKRAGSSVFDVRKLKSVVVKNERPEHPEPFGPPEAKTSAAALPARVTQKQIHAHSLSPAPAPDSSFDGLDFANWGAGHPPDENGDVGPNYYIQTVNTSIGIYDKTNGSRVAAFSFNAFMSQGNFGNLCDTNNFGDPVVLYDSFENRWFITDFAFVLDGAGNVSPQTVFQCFAVSKTGDPVNGGWNYYSILDPGGLGDYPKFGVWPDGIYMSANVFGYAAGSGYAGYHMWALNKQQMYAGAPQASVVDFSGDTNDFTVIPANARLQDGTPPAGTPEYFVSTEQYLNALSIYKLQVNWDKISTSTFTGAGSELAPNCFPNQVPANATTPANAADVIPLRAMAQVQYTNRGGAESLWVSHTVQRNVSASNSVCDATTGGNASVRWYQANVTGGTVAANVVQGATFDPEAANTFFRFQPSLAVDRAGDMAIGYTKSNSTTHPQIKYAGRLAGDPANTLPQAEQTLIDGTGSQSGNCGGAACIRWGDYSGMALDPNGCEFWMTGEYYATSGLNYLTRIGSFHYPGCTPIGNGTLSGTVTDGANAISGATVSLGSRTTTTNGNGAYSFSVPAGIYPSVTVDAPGFNQGSASSLVVPNSGTLTKNFALSAASQSGCFTDNSQSLFQRGVPATGCDITSSPGSMILSKASSVDQQNTGGTTTGTSFGTPNWTGQTFTEGVTGHLTSVDFTVFCNGCTSNPNLAVSIRATSGGLPTGADLASTSVAGDTSGASATLTATFSTPPTLTAGTQYALIVRPESNPGGAGYFWIRSSPSTYAGGSRVLSGDSGSTWSADTTRDFNFHAYVSSGYVPSATFVSSLRDANPAAGATPHWTTLSFTATTPTHTAVKFQVAGSNSVYGPFNYVGPDGTASTYYTTSGGGLSQFNGDRYLRYKAFLSTTDPTVTPTLSSVSTCFQDGATKLATTLVVASASGTYGGTTTLSATLTAGGSAVPGATVNFTVNGVGAGGATTNASGVATLQNVSLSGITAGSYPTGVAASFAGDSSYAASGGSNSLTVSKADQAIQITTHAPATAVAGTGFTVAATGGASGNTVTYGSSGACTNSGADFTMTSDTGTCKVTYDQAGNANYKAAPQQVEMVTALKAVKCNVPKLVGKTLAAATSALKTANCTLGTVKRQYSAKKKGTVIAQSPAPGTTASNGAPVNVTLSKGKKR